MKNDIEEDYCSFEVCKLLKERRFGPKREWNPEYIFGYGERGADREFQEEDYAQEGNYLKPTHNVALKWIRENFQLCIIITISDEWELSDSWSHVKKAVYGYDIYNTSGEWLERHTNFKFPEKAIEAALLYTLEKLIS